MDRIDILKFYDMQTLDMEPEEEEVLIASLAKEPVLEASTVFSRVDRKIALVERVVLASARMVEFANPCQHAPYPEGRTCDVGASGEHKPSESGTAGSGVIAKYGLVGEDADYVQRKLDGAYGDPEKIAKIEKKVTVAQETMNSPSFGADRKAQYYPDGKPVPGSDEWLGAHGISRSVFENRPYVRIPKGGPIPPEVLALYEGEPKALKQLDTVLTQEPAWVMTRTPVPGMEQEFGKVVPQTRPDNPVVTNKAELAARQTGVNRAEARVESVNKLTSESSGEHSVVTLQETRIENTAARLEAAKTMTKEKYLEKDGKALEDAQAAVVSAKAGGATKEELDLLKSTVATKKRNLESTEKRAGFLFKDGDEAYQAVETANVTKQLAYAKTKLEKYKADPVNALEHEKELAKDNLDKARTARDEVAIKYIFPPNLTAGEKARVKEGASPEDLEIGGSLAGVDLGKAGRVEIHGAENIKNFVGGKGRVYLAMEGNIKSDAVQTAIAAEGEKGASVISVPSVTLWRNPEMLAVAKKYLNGREVVLIPDADGVKNPNVRNESRALQSMLESAGARVVVAAPPLNYISDKTGRVKKIGEVQEVTLPSGAKEELKGVDDYLGAGKVIGASLGGLDVLERKVPKDTIQSDLDADLDLPTTSRPKSSKVMMALSNLLGEKGSGRVSIRMLSAAVGDFSQNSGKNIGYLENSGFVKVERLYDPEGLAKGVRRLNPAMTPERVAELHKAGVISSSDLDFDRPVDHGYLETPIITIVNPKHRATDSLPHALGIRSQVKVTPISMPVPEPTIDEENPFSVVLSNSRVDMLRFGSSSLEEFDALDVDEYNAYLQDINDHWAIYSSSYGDLERPQERGIDYID